HVPCDESSAATRSQTSALREEMYTFAPASTKPRAIMSPIPREPPVTSVTLPATENRSFMASPMGAGWRRVSGKAKRIGTDEHSRRRCPREQGLYCRAVPALQVGSTLGRRALGADLRGLRAGGRRKWGRAG